MGPRVLVIDNYDSFVYNLVQYLGELGAEPEVYRPDEISLEGIEDLRPNALVISPGPGRPEDAKLSNATIERFAGGRIAEIWVARDELGLLRQIGAIPEREPAAAA